MKKISAKTLLTLAGLVCLAGGNLHAQVEDLKALVYGGDTAPAGTAPGTGTGTLGPFTVTQIYTNTTATYTFNFISDASGVSDYVYQPISASAPDPFTVGSTYTGLSLTSAPFGTPTNLELTVPTGTTVPAPTATAVAGMYSLVAEGALTTTSVLTDNYTVATATTPNDIEAVQFTFTPSAAQTVTPVTGNYTGTDANNGDVVNFYRPTNGLTFATGRTYTIDGYAFGFSTGTEIYDPSIISSVPAAIPEPSTSVMLGLSVLAGLLVTSRMRRSRRA